MFAVLVLNVSFKETSTFRDLTQQAPPTGSLHYVFMARLLQLMRSGEVYNLLGFNTNNIVEEGAPEEKLE